MLEKMNLQAHEDKSGAIILGYHDSNRKFEHELKINQIQFNGFPMKRKSECKYLGQILKDNLSVSAFATVKSRESKIKGATMEIKSIIEDFRMQKYAGLEAAVELWEKALIPSLLNGAGSWLGNIKDAVKLCNDIQNFYWRVMLEIPASTPKIALQCETGSMDMNFRIYKEKCLLFSRIKALNNDFLAKEVFTAAVNNNWPGIHQEVNYICRELNIEDLNLKSYSKKELDKIFLIKQKEKIFKEISLSHKLKDLIYEDFNGYAEYFKDKNIQDARIKFRIRTKMLKNIPTNFRNQFVYNKEKLLCEYCPEELSQSHLMVCNRRAELRKGSDLNNLD